MDYDQLSDFEINTAVFETLYGGTPDYKEGDNGAMILISYEGDIVGGDAVEVEVERGMFNPCNNPTDAWSIIHKEGISIAFDSWEDEWLAWGEFNFDPLGWNMRKTPEIARGDKNPLRAAMIVFLMMQE